MLQTSYVVPCYGRNTTGCLSFIELLNVSLTHLGFPFPLMTSNIFRSQKENLLSTQTHANPLRAQGQRGASIAVASREATVRTSGRMCLTARTPRTLPASLLAAPSSSVRPCVQPIDPSVEQEMLVWHIT